MLIDKLPDLYKTSNEVVSIQSSLENEREVLEANVLSLIDDLFVVTSQNIYLWENLVGIKSDTTKHLDYRKTNVIAKIRGKGTTTINLIKNISESYINGQVEVTEINSSYKFIVKFVGVKGIPPNLEDLKAAIEEAKPAHLEVAYEFTYNVWALAKTITWNNAKTKTWKILREGVI